MSSSSYLPSEAYCLEYKGDASPESCSPRISRGSAACHVDLSQRCHGVLRPCNGCNSENRYIIRICMTTISRLTVMTRSGAQKTQLSGYCGMYVGACQLNSTGITWPNLPTWHPWIVHSIAHLSEALLNTMGVKSSSSSTICVPSGTMMSIEPMPT